MPARYDRRRATVVAFDAPAWDPPAAVVLDTNVVAEALLSREPEHSACDELFKHQSTTQTLVVFNRLLEVELFEVVFNHAVRTHSAEREIRHSRFLPAIRRAATERFDEAMSEWHSLLDHLNWDCADAGGCDAAHDATAAEPHAVAAAGRLRLG